MPNCLVKGFSPFSDKPVPGRMKSKWVAALKHIKGKPELVHGGQNPIIENCHVFLENTYKKITPCDVCSQVLRGESILL